MTKDAKLLCSILCRLQKTILRRINVLVTMAALGHGLQAEVLGQMYPKSSFKNENFLQL